MKIPVSRVEIGHEEVAAVQDVLLSGNLAQGSQVAAFEEEFSQLAVSGAPSVATNSGTSAQHLGMVALGVGPGDEVIVPSFTFAATANAVAFTGATPVFVDIEPNYFTINPEAVEAAITRRTVGIVAVHLFGHPADMTALSRIASRHSLWLFEDAAQGHLAQWTNRLVGTIGDAASFSFYPTKNITSGEGGMLVTSDAQIERTVRLLRNQGQEHRYFNEVVGLNNRMTDIHAAIGRTQLKSLEPKTVKRRQNAAFFTQYLSGVRTPPTAPSAEHVFHQYSVLVETESRDRAAELLRRLGVETGIYYPTPVHKLPAYGLDIHLPETERICCQILSLPVYPSLSDKELLYIVDAVNSVVG